MKENLKSQSDLRIRMKFKLLLLIIFICPYLNPSSAAAQSTETVEGIMLFGGLGQRSTSLDGLSGRGGFPTINSYVNVDNSGSNYIYIPVTASMNIDIAYTVWTLLGESVWSFITQYSLPNEIRVYHNETCVLRIKRGSNIPVNFLESSAANTSCRTVRVSADIYSKMSINSFNFSASFASNPDVMIVRRNPGIMVGEEEWGWDVPGNPLWSKMFVQRRGYGETGTALLSIHRNAFRASSIPESYWLSEEEAKAVYLEHRGVENPLVPSSIWGIQMSVMPVIREIRKHAPEALADYYSRPRDSQAVAMLNALEGSSANRNSTEFRNQVSTLRNALERFGNDVSPELIEELDRIANQDARDRLANQTRQLSRMVTAVVQNTPEDSQPEWPGALANRLDNIYNEIIELNLPPADPLWTQLANLRNLIIESDIDVEREMSLNICDEWSAANSGGEQGTLDRWDISSIPEGAVFDIRYNAYSVPDRYEVDYPIGNRVLNTGWRGSRSYAGSRYPGGIQGPGSGTASNIFQKRGVNQFVVRVFGGGSGTAWNYQVRCRIPE